MLLYGGVWTNEDMSVTRTMLVGDSQPLKKRWRNLPCSSRLSFASGLGSREAIERHLCGSVEPELGSSGTVRCVTHDSLGLPPLSWLDPGFKNLCFYIFSDAFYKHLDTHLYREVHYNLEISKCWERLEQTTVFPVTGLYICCLQMCQCPAGAEHVLAKGSLSPTSISLLCFPSLSVNRSRAGTTGGEDFPQAPFLPF